MEKLNFIKKWKEHVIIAVSNDIC